MCGCALSLHSLAAYSSPLTLVTQGSLNPWALRAMACGVPTIISANTGHLDLIEPALMYDTDGTRRTIPDASVGGWV